MHNSDQRLIEQSDFVWEVFCIGRHDIEMLFAAVKYRQLSERDFTILVFSTSRVDRLADLDREGFNQIMDVLFPAKAEANLRHGHWRRQPYGPGRGEFRLQWIKPTFVRPAWGEQRHDHVYTLGAS